MQYLLGACQGASGYLLWSSLLLEVYLLMVRATKRYPRLPCLQEWHHQGKVDPHIHKGESR